MDSPADPVYAEMFKYAALGVGAELMKQWALPAPDARQNGGTRRATSQGPICD